MLEYSAYRTNGNLYMFICIYGSCELAHVGGVRCQYLETLYLIMLGEN